MTHRTSPFSGSLAATTCAVDIGGLKPHAFDAAPVVAIESAGEDMGSWNKLLPAGTFTARDGRGPFHAGGTGDMQIIVDRAKAYLGGTEMMIDYDHQILSAAPAGGTARAAGWVKAFEVREDGIWGKVEWTAAARQAIKAGEYRYLSPLFYPEKDTGRVVLLRNAALVNAPALDLDAIAASAGQGILTLNNHEGKAMDKILEALGLKPGDGEAAALAAIAQLKTSVSAVAAAAGVDGVVLSDLTALTAGVAALKSASQDRPDFPDPAKYVPIEAVAAMQADLKALKEGIGKDRAEAAVDTAIKEGRLSPAMRDWGLALAAKDFASFEAFATGAPSLTKAQLGTDAGKPGTDAAALSAGEALICKQMGLTTEAFLASKKELEA
ncbi:phage protease [Roseibium litorale]|uniref:Phage I-like protein n=1 Tax=Roseibium litorale TaxID=2803841 RepID=A0ABR9CIP5_9HYPH|nr:phage protease [Roseibium litorale]MBD8890157.1 hypothetical protein [Roseibium litorale]